MADEHKGMSEGIGGLMTNRMADQIAWDPRYNTKLPPELEAAFQEWKAINAPKDSGYDYDLRGAFLAGLNRDPETDHFDDKFKKPNHPSFSVYSIYAKDQPGLAGIWAGSQYLPPELPYPVPKPRR